jgi:hypothetical protein
MAVARISAIVFSAASTFRFGRRWRRASCGERELELDLTYTANSVEQLSGLALPEQQSCESA